METKDRRSRAIDKWDDGVYVRCYLLAKSGMADAKIAEAIGVTPKTLKDWKDRFPALADAIAQGRTGENGTQTFHEYVYERLPPKLKRLWDEINELEKAPNGVRKIEAMLTRAGLRARQHLFLHALISSNFNASEACRKVNVSRRTFDQWKSYDPEFADLVSEVDWHKANFFDGALCALVRDGVPAAVIFANKTFNKKRYGETVKVEGTYLHKHEHEHKVIPIDELNLPIEVRRQMLEAYRAKSQTVDSPGFKSLPAHEED